MDICLDPNQSALTTPQLPRELYYQIVHALRDALPAPVTDTPEDRARRDNAIIALVASLRPATTDEVILAAQYVAAAAQALDCLRLARLCPTDVPRNLRCTAQSASMMRQSRAARAQLLRLQAERAKRDADTAARGKAAGTKHAAIDPVAPTAAPPPPTPEPGQATSAPTEAEKYALAHPSRAALIRSLGRLPKRFDGPPLSPGLVHDIVNGTSPILQALAKRPNHRLTAG